MKKLEESEIIRRKELGLRLKKLRKACNLTQIEIADAIRSEGWNQKSETSAKAYISRVESGQYVLSDDAAEDIAADINQRIELDENIRKCIEKTYHVYGEPSTLVRGDNSEETVMTYNSMYLDPNYLTGKSSYFSYQAGVKQQQKFTAQFVFHLLPIINLLGYKLLDPKGNEITAAQNVEADSQKKKSANGITFDTETIGNLYYPLYKTTDDPIMRIPYANQSEYDSAARNYAEPINFQNLGAINNISLRLKSPEGKIVMVFPSDFRDMLLNIYQDVDISLARAVQRGKPAEEEKIQNYRYTATKEK